MIPYFRLVRIQNLAMLVVIQFCIRQFVIVPILQIYDIQRYDEQGLLWLLIISTISIAAGGYVINDYFDQKIDIINRPEKQIVGNIVSRNTAMIIFQVLTGIGIISGIILAWIVQSTMLGILFIAIPGLLWFYSASYKRQFLTGNLVIALMAALSIFMVGMMEVAALHLEYSDLIFSTPVPAQLYGWSGGFALFAFLVTLIREIIKDMEDEHGDREMECRTLPIVWGSIRAKWFISALTFITIVLLIVALLYFIEFQDSLSLKYISIGIIIPLIALLVLVWTSKTPAQYHSASGFSKLIMISGIAYTLVFYFLLAQKYQLLLFNTFLIQ